MAALEHRFDRPDRFVAGTVGRPGERTFFLQARQGNALVSAVCEKFQVQVLAEHVERILDEVEHITDGRVQVPPARETASDNEPLDAPIEEDFRVGTMTIAWDPDTERVQIEVYADSDEPTVIDAEGLEEATAETLAAFQAEQSAEVMVVSLSLHAARDFVARAKALVAAGRPPCPFCAQPLDAGGHICPRANGYRKPLFDL